MEKPRHTTSSLSLLSPRAVVRYGIPRSPLALVPMHEEVEAEEMAGMVPEGAPVEGGVLLWQFEDEIGVCVCVWVCDMCVWV